MGGGDLGSRRERPVSVEQSSQEHSTYVSDITQVQRVKQCQGCMTRPELVTNDSVGRHSEWIQIHAVHSFIQFMRNMRPFVRFMFYSLDSASKCLCLHFIAAVDRHVLGRFRTMNKMSCNTASPNTAIPNTAPPPPPSRACPVTTLCCVLYSTSPNETISFTDTREQSLTRSSYTGCRTYTPSH